MSFIMDLPEVIDAPAWKDMASVSSPDAGVDTLEDQLIMEPPQYKVLLHNDDITTMDFVVDILCRIFHKNPVEAEAIMMNVHNNGIGVCGVYTQEIAEAKVNLVHREASFAGFPLKCSMEKD